MPVAERCAAVVWIALAAALAVHVSAQDKPVESVTNSYFTPKQTYTPISTLQSAQGGKPMTISGHGPSERPGPYTWNYSAALSTLAPTQNSALSSSLAKSLDIRPEASNLQPDPEHLQVRTDRGAGPF